ncbi:hypothetical protein CSUB01_12408 [Colletotrichum sublineola]|uniref:Uncharacterized protein n=1 Tax=Colletotrichum sublineola TaxID=1173701 RepID=A0A066X8K2_COLSU|nr:hypothetical protein CSUB01_12408 [Colletotrichum sublineola]
MAKQQSETQQNVLPFDWSSWSAGSTQQYPSMTPRPYCHSFDGCDVSQLYPPYYNLPTPGISSTTQQYSGEPETPRYEESHNAEDWTEVFSSPMYSHLEEEKRYVLNTRLRDEPGHVTKETYENRSQSFRRVDRPMEKDPEVEAIVENNGIINNAQRSIKKRQTARMSGAHDDRTAANDGEVGVRRLSAEDAIRAAQTVLYFLGRPDYDGLVTLDDCMALMRIASQLNQLNRLNQQ